MNFKTHFFKMALFILTFVLTCVLNLSNANEFAKKQELEEFVMQVNDELKEMKDKIIHIEQSIAEQRLENDDLNKRLSVLQSEKVDLGGIIRRLSSKIRRLEVKNIKSVSQNEIENNVVKETTDDGQNDNVKEGREEENDTAVNCESKHVDVAESKKKSAESNSILLRRQLIEENHNIAFSVFVKDDITGLSKGDVIKFDGVMVNDGSGYDVTSGMFTAPRSGLYLFAFVVEDYHDQDLWVVLYEDNLIRSQAVAEPFDSHQNIMGGNLVLLHVREGARIWVAIFKGDRVQENWSTFTGILLH